MGPKQLKTHCINGHEFTEANTYVVAFTGARKCIACKKEYGRKYQKMKTQMAREKRERLGL